MARRPDERRQARHFALILAGAFLVWAGWSIWRDHPTRTWVAAGLAVLFPALAFGLPAVWLWLFRRWMRYAEVLSWVSTRVILTIFYFLILTPYAMVMRLAGRRPGGGGLPNSRQNQE